MVDRHRQRYRRHIFSNLVRSLMYLSGKSQSQLFQQVKHLRTRDFHARFSIPQDTRGYFVGSDDLPRASGSYAVHLWRDERFVWPTTDVHWYSRHLHWCYYWLLPVLRALQVGRSPRSPS